MSIRGTIKELNLAIEDLKRFRDSMIRDKINCYVEDPNGTMITEAGILLSPVEIDDWHPASDPPTDKDFPILTKYGTKSYLAVHAYKTWLEVRDRVSHWLSITPPKQ